MTIREASNLLCQDEWVCKREREREREIKIKIKIKNNMVPVWPRKKSS